MKISARECRDGQALVLGFVAALLLAHLTVDAAPAAIGTATVSQAVQLERGVASVRVFLDVREASGQHTSVSPEQISGSLGQEVLELAEAYPFRSSGQGVAYVFLIDISASLSQREFELIREALDVWIVSLRPTDRVAIIAFGNESKVIVDFTRDQTRIQAALYSLAPVDQKTVLHQALRQGLELCTRRDPDLPGRRVMMVLTDGRDEGSGLTTEDVLDLLRRDPVPIYAIGVSRIKDPRERKRYLDLLRRFSANSGGTFHEATTATLGTAYESIRRAIHGVTVADFTCRTCPADGEEYRLQVQIDDGGRVLSSGRSLRLFPVARKLTADAGLLPAPGPLRQDEAPAEVERPSQDAPEVPAIETKGEADDGPSFPYWESALVLALLIAVTWLLLRRRGRGPETHESAADDSAATAEERPPEPVAVPAAAGSEPKAADSDSADTGSIPIVPPQTYTLESGVETTRPPRPAIMRLVRLIVVRGAKPGRQYTLTLFKNAVVGSRSTCDAVLVDPGVAPEQFELLQRDGRVYIRNLAGSNPTLVDGLTATEQHPFKSGALVGNRDFIVRIVYDEARPINT